MNKKYYIGIDLGGTKIYTAIGDENGDIINETIVKTETEKGYLQIVDKIKESVKKVKGEVKIEEIQAIGIGSPGPLNIKKGLIVDPPNLPFKNFNIVEELEKEFNIPVFLDNDANVATLAEYSFGAGIGTENMVFVTASTGVGGGAILNGKIYRGSTSNALEVGHTTVNANGKRCGCGNRGCVEIMSSGTAIMNGAIEAVKTNVNTNLKEYKNVTAKEVFIEASKGDRVAMEILNESLRYLGIGIANIANSFDPDMIVIGGGVINGGEIVFEVIKEEMRNRCLKPILENCKVERAKLDGKSGVLGAIALAILESK